MGTLEDLREIYDAFCAFGSNRNLSNPHGSLESIAGPTMDGAKFAKFARDNKLIDNKRVTSTDVDITFNKVKPKGSRKLDWNTFLDGLTDIAEKKNPGKKGRDALDIVIGTIMKKGGGPIATGTTPKNDAITDRLTDTSKYTGTHKLRFDEAGRGRGAEGRDRASATDQLSKITNREETSVRGLPMSIDPQEKDKTSKRSHSNLATASSDRLDQSSSKPKSTKKGSNTNLASKSSPAAKSEEYTAKGGSVFDRLTDSNQYTGAHKHRFNADGSGKGIVGRDSPSKGGGPGTYRGGDVKDLSQILRS
ncbi:p25-alpha-domain-containing protein [Phlyctochytrium arcticum]|nr:p25-alpha-domain-containing protein [Phlyctochytrium arcticum]